VSVGVCAVALLFALAGPLDAGIRTPVRLQELTMALALTFALALALLSVPEPVLAQAASVHYPAPQRRGGAASSRRTPCRDAAAPGVGCGFFFFSRIARAPVPGRQTREAPCRTRRYLSFYVELTLCST
jgi:hypothetical protein